MRLLFHELVHVAQYAQMDLKEFAARFINGFIQGGSYEEIPLEKMASCAGRPLQPERDQVFLSTMKCGSGAKRTHCRSLFAQCCLHTCFAPDSRLLWK